MLNAQDLSEAFARNVRIIKMQTDGLTHEDSLLQLPFNGNCLNWVLGHIATSRNNMLKIFGEASMINANGTRYQRGSNPITEANEGEIVPLEKLLLWLELTQEEIAAALSKKGETELTREMTFEGRKVTLIQRLFFLYFHETYHVGQTELFRQLAGKNDKII